MWRPARKHLDGTEWNEIVLGVIMKIRVLVTATCAKTSSYPDLMHELADTQGVTSKCMQCVNSDLSE